MFNSISRAVRSALIVAAGIFCLFGSSPAQFSIDGPSAVRQLRAMPAQRIERGLPAMQFDSWIDDLVGPNSSTTWEAGECSKPPGMPQESSWSNLPVCTRVTAVITNEIVVNIFIVFGRYHRGIVSQPFVRFIFVGDKTLMSGAEYTDLRSMRRQFIKIRNALVRFDTSDGDFQLAADGPGSFEGATEIMLVTSDQDMRGRSTPVKPFGTVYIGTELFQMRHILFDGKRLAFETEVLKGVSFKFDGRYQDLKVDSHGAYTEATTLRGHMVKLVNGKKISDADLTFHYAYYPGC